jgi:hypothetical protein
MFKFVQFINCILIIVKLQTFKVCCLFCASIFFIIIIIIQQSIQVSQPFRLFTIIFELTWYLPWKAITFEFLDAYRHYM